LFIISCSNKKHTPIVVDQTNEFNAPSTSSNEKTTTRDTTGTPEVFDPRFNAFTRGRIEQNKVFYVDFELTSVSLQKDLTESFQPPTFDDLHLVAGPEISSSTEIILGKIKRNVNWRYTLLPLRRGVFLIGSASVRVDNKVISTRRLEIETQGVHLISSEENKELTIEGWREFKKMTLETDRNEDNDVWHGSIYRNKEYHLRIQFPTNWEYDKGMSINTLARAIDRQRGITLSVAVQHLPVNVPDSMNIYKRISSDASKEFFKKAFEQAYSTTIADLEVEKSVLHNIPAYMLTATFDQTSMDRTITFMMKQIICLKQSKYYSVQILLPEEI
jgi:hypothetical protein